MLLLCAKKKKKKKWTRYGKFPESTGSTLDTCKTDNGESLISLIWFKRQKRVHHVVRDIEFHNSKKKNFAKLPGL